MGSGEIPDQFPGMVADALAGDGIAWPPVPGLDAALAPFVADGAVPDPAAASAAGLTEAPAGSAAPAKPAAEHDPFAVIPVTGGDEEDDPIDRIARDPVGNGIAIVVLLLLGLSIIAAPLLAMRGSLPDFPSPIVIVLVVVGMAVAAYLATVETNGSEAVCGPVGDCNAVQESEYARVFGVHVGVLGLVGYALIGLLWIVSRLAQGALADWALVLIALGTMLGVAFSAYLTFLEPFVIGATCMWCITSALVMLALLWVSVGPGYQAWRRIRGASDGDDGTVAT